MPRTFCKYLIIIAMTLIGLCMQACSSGTADYDTDISEARLALEQGELEQAYSICNSLFNNDLDKLSEMQLGHLAILYVKLGEAGDTEEEMANAIVCFRKAWKLSEDSMRGFSAQLLPEELPQYAILSRISGAIDAPEELGEAEFYEDSTAFHVDSIHAAAE